jgi:hypothetical protein
MKEITNVMPPVPELVWDLAMELVTSYARAVSETPEGHTGVQIGQDIGKDIAASFMGSDNDLLLVKVPTGEFGYSRADDSGNDGVYVWCEHRYAPWSRYIEAAETGSPRPWTYVTPYRRSRNGVRIASSVTDPGWQLRCYMEPHLVCQESNTLHDRRRYRAQAWRLSESDVAHYRLDKKALGCWAVCVPTMRDPRKPDKPITPRSCLRISSNKRTILRIASAYNNKRTEVDGATYGDK